MSLASACPRHIVVPGLALALFYVAPLPLGAQPTPPPTPLLPREAQLPATVKLSKALELLASRTGNTIASEHHVKTMGDPDLSLRQTQGTFWQMLDHVTTTAKLGWTPYGAEGTVTLTSRGNQGTAAHAGLFRVAPRTVGLVRTEEVNVTRCKLGLQVVWEPRLTPLFISLRDVKVDYEKPTGPVARGTVDSTTRQAVAGLNASDIDLSFEAPDRGCPAISRVTGEIMLVVPVAMLDVSFDKLSNKKSEHVKQFDDVATRVLVDPGPGGVLVTVKVLHRQAVPPLDSFENWLATTRVWMERDVKGKATRVLPDPGDTVEWNDKSGDITCRFALKPKEVIDGATLHCRLPGTIVVVRQRFELGRITLP